MSSEKSLLILPETTSSNDCPSILLLSDSTQSLPELHGVSPSKVNISSVFEFDGVIIAAKLVSFESASIYHRWRSSCQVSFARKLVGVCRFFCLMSIILILVAAGALSMSYPTCFRSSNPRKYALKAFNHIQMHGR